MLMSLLMGVGWAGQGTSLGAGFQEAAVSGPSLSSDFLCKIFLFTLCLPWIYHTISESFLFIFGSAEHAELASRVSAPRWRGVFRTPQELL